MKKQTSTFHRTYKHLVASIIVCSVLTGAAPCSWAQARLAMAGRNLISQTPAAAANSDDSQAKTSDADQEASKKENAPVKRRKKSESKEESSKSETPLVAGDKKPYSEEAIKHYNRGVELHQSGFLNQAITEYKAAIESDGRMEEAFSNLGVIYAAQRNYPRAKDAFSTALTLKPNRPTTLNGLGTVLYAQGHIKEAKEKWEQALSVDPNFASAYYNVGNAYESEKDTAGAINSYARAIAAIPSMADAYYRIGSIYYKQRHYPQASVLLKKAIELSPDSDFVREAKRMESNLESDFAKSESDSRRNRAYPASKATEVSVQSEQPGNKPKQAGKKKGKSEGLDMFVQPADNADKAATSGAESSPQK